jgi:dTDP-4-dehydrorhamnose reductase
MKILITGSAGMLGTGVVPALVRSGHHVVPTDINLANRRPWGVTMPMLGHLDVRSADSVAEAIAAERPDHVMHLGAETSLEVSEADPDHAWLTNAVGTKHVAIATARNEIPMTYISTAGVFDGTKRGAYIEYDDPNPINVYGASKFQGEQYVRWFNPQAYIVRAGWMVGGGVKDHKFVSRTAQQLRDGRDTVYAVVDKLGTPTYVPDFSACLTRLITTDSFGLYHMACEGEGTRYDVAACIIEAFGLSERVRLVPVGSEFFAEEFSAPRPPSEIMRNLVLDLQGLNSMRPWRVALREYLACNFADVPERWGVDAVVNLRDQPQIPVQARPVDNHPAAFLES